MSPKWRPPAITPAKVTAPTGGFEESAEFFEYLQAQFQARAKTFSLEGDTYTWANFCEETGFGFARRQRLAEAALAAEIREQPQANNNPPAPKVAKSRSSSNAMKHGLYSKKLVLSPAEEPLLQVLRAELERVNQPVDQRERDLVNQIAERTVRLTQLRAYEAAIAGPWTKLKPQIRKAIRAAEREIQQKTMTLQHLQTARGPKSDSQVGASKSLAEAA